MASYLQTTQILIAAILIVVVLLQAKGSGLGGIFGSDLSVYRTKRGIERLLFQFTIVLSVLFVLISMLAVRVR